MPLIEDWSFVVGNVVAGDGTPYCPAGPIGGLGSAPQRAFVAPRGDRYGQVAGRDVHDSRVLTFPVLIRGDGGTRRARMASAIGRLIELTAAWGEAVGAGERALELRMPGFPGIDSTLTYYGRPRLVTPDVSGDALGHVPALLEFHALDPYGYLPSQETALGASVEVVNEGTAPTDRAVVTITSPGRPVLRKSSTGETIAFAEDLTAGATVNLRTGHVRDNGVDVSRKVAPGPLWFDLDPGGNLLELTGTTGTIAVQSAYNV